MPRSTAPHLLAALILLGVWVALAIILGAGYRPGGPVDGLVAAATMVPAAAAAAAVIWPPRIARPVISAAVLWLGIGSILVLAPLLLEIVHALAAGGRQTLLPSPEIAYAGLVAIAGTCTYAAIGVVTRRSHGMSVPRPARALGATCLAVLLTVAGAGLFGGLALANEQALRSRPAASSAWGPTDPGLVPPPCSRAPSLGPAATVQIDASATIDRQVAGNVVVVGVRAGSDEAWSAELSGRLGSGTLDFRQEAGAAQLRRDGAPPQPLPSGFPGRDGGSPAPAGTLDGPTLDALRALEPEAVAQDLAIELFDGAAARHCRAQIAGPAALRASFPLRWLIDPDLDPADGALDAWRGDLEWWVFADGQLGRAVVTVSGYPGEAWGTPGISATLRATLTALDRDGPQSLPGG